MIIYVAGTQRNLQKFSSGLSLVEILVTVFILTVGILSTLVFFTNTMTANQISRDMTEATTHSEYILEEMRARPTLANITATDWTSWVTNEGIKTLPAESMTISYTNQLADPLRVNVRANWTRRSRSLNVSLETEVTK